jgi:hypothetical protein
MKRLLRIDSERVPDISRDRTPGSACLPFGAPVHDYNARMAKSTAAFDMVREIGRVLPGVEESTHFGQPALKIRGIMFACLASHRSAEPGSLVVLVGFPRRQELIDEAPDVYYLTEHYVGHPSVLVRLDKIQQDALRGLLLGALQFVRVRQTKRRSARD